MKKLLLVISMLIFAMLMTACGGGGSKSVFTEPGAIGKIVGELQNKDGLKGQELKVFQDITIVSGKDYGGNFISINILKPGTKEDVDHYEYRNGSWSGPSAVKITGSGNMEDNLIALQALNMDKIPEMYKAFQEKVSDKKDVKVKESLVYRFWKGDWTVMMDAESDREAYSAEFDLNGKMIDFKKR